MCPFCTRALNVALRPHQQTVLISSMVSAQRSSSRLPSKQLAAKIRPQAVANHGNLALIDDIHQLACTCAAFIK